MDEQELHGCLVNVTYQGTKGLNVELSIYDDANLYQTILCGCDNHCAKNLTQLY
jgi:hypothetical protein